MKKKVKKVKVTTNKNKNKNQINININSHNKRRNAPRVPKQPNNTSIIVSTPHVPYIPQDNGLQHIYPILQNIHEKVSQHDVNEVRDILSNIDNSIQNIERTKSKMNKARNSGYLSEDIEAGFSPLRFVSPRPRPVNKPPTVQSPYKESADFVDEFGSDELDSSVVVVKKVGRPKGAKNKPK